MQDHYNSDNIFATALANFRKEVQSVMCDTVPVNEVKETLPLYHRRYQSFEAKCKDQPVKENNQG